MTLVVEFPSKVSRRCQKPFKGQTQTTTCGPPIRGPHLSPMTSRSGVSHSSLGTQMLVPLFYFACEGDGYILFHRGKSGKVRSSLEKASRPLLVCLANLQPAAEPVLPPTYLFGFCSVRSAPVEQCTLPYRAVPASQRIPNWPPIAKSYSRSRAEKDSLLNPIILSAVQQFRLMGTSICAPSPTLHSIRPCALQRVKYGSLNYCSPERFGKGVAEYWRLERLFKPRLAWPWIRLVGYQPIRPILLKPSCTTTQLPVYRRWRHGIFWRVVLEISSTIAYPQCSGPALGLVSSRTCDFLTVNVGVASAFSTLEKALISSMRGRIVFDAASSCLGTGIHRLLRYMPSNDASHFFRKSRRPTSL